MAIEMLHVEADHPMVWEAARHLKFDAARLFAATR